MLINVLKSSRITIPKIVDFNTDCFISWSILREFTFPVLM